MKEHAVGVLGRKYCVDDNGGVTKKRWGGGKFKRATACGNERQHDRGGRLKGEK